MKWAHAIALTALALMSAGSASAHEFWMVPDRFQAPAGGAVSLSMRVGENFEGDLVGLSGAFVTTLHRYAGGVDTDLARSIPAEPAGAMRVPLLPSGTQLFWADTQPSHVELDAGRFHAYLHDEGMDEVIAAREKAGVAQTPGRERFRRHVKTLVRAGGDAGPAAMQSTGQRLEILPESDPTAGAPGRDISFRVLWEGQPLPRALVKFWHRRGGQLFIIRVRTDAQGRLIAAPPWPGLWMASVVHMIAATDAPDADWDSYWGSLTFELPTR